VGALLAAALVVHIGCNGYTDANGTPMGFGDALYYATISRSTTGCGDIVSVTDTARLMTTLVITPLRALFLIVLVGTTLELLTERSRHGFGIKRWHLLRRSGADCVVVSEETAGRLLGVAAMTPRVVDVVEDLITPSAGLTISERRGEHAEVDESPRHLTDIVLGVIRGGALHRIDDGIVDPLAAGDRLLYIRKASTDGNGPSTTC
jgi:voltage-gated potassium channel Kch